MQLLGMIFIEEEKEVSTRKAINISFYVTTLLEGTEVDRHQVVRFRECKFGARTLLGSSSYS